MPKRSFEEFNPINKHYAKLLEATKQKIVSTRIKVAKTACKEQISLYWWLGQQIVYAQEKYGWGKSVVEQLSLDLKKVFSGTTAGFSPQNLWYMRKFYLEYKDYPNLQRLVGEIGWGQNIVIMSKIKDITAREYYLSATHQMGWTRNILELNVDSQAYERQVLENKYHNFNKALPVHLAVQADKTMKSIYMLDTLGLTQPVLEYQIENRMVSKIQDVMLELGYGFAFIGSQYRITSPNGTESFIDLLFSNRRLRCLVAFELKSGRFKPEYAGKMNYYLNLLDDFVKEEWENPSIGIILCASKDHIDVDYALRGIDKPIGVSEFKLTRTLPSELSGKLPEAKKIEAEILRAMDTPDNDSEK
jgi:predicted nuclease of restriction endonuclease-like (RecB) superfamily